MKKILILSFFLFALGGIASAQKKESKAKTEKTSTVPQKVHNVIHPKHKKYSGRKTKHKTSTK